MSKPYRLPSGRWRIRWLDHGSERQSETFATRAAAVAGLRRRLVEADDIRTGRVALPRDSSTLAEFSKRWLASRTASRGTVDSYKLHLDCHLLPALGAYRLEDVAGEVVDRFFADMHGKVVGEFLRRPIGAKTIYNVRGTLRSILGTAVEWGELTKIPSLPKIKVPEAPFDFLTFEESDVLIGAARNDEQRALLLCGLHTGMRQGEQRALEWTDIEKHNGRIVIARSMDEDGRLGPTKGRRVRYVPLTPELAAALKRIEHLRGPLIFCRGDGSYLRKTSFHERLWGTCRRAGLRKIRWHDLRHTYASHLVMHGVPLKRVQELLGHTTLVQTMRYAHLAPGGDGDVISALSWPRGGHAATSIDKARESQNKLVTPPGLCLRHSRVVVRRTIELVAIPPEGASPPGFSTWQP
jgi:integrase